MNLSPTALVVERIQRAQLRRLRRSCGAGLELPEERNGSGWIVLACIGGAVCCVVLGLVLR